MVNPSNLKIQITGSMSNNVCLVALSMRLQSIALCSLMLLGFSLAAAFDSRAYPQASDRFNRILAISGPVTLDIAIAKAEITIVQGRDDRLVISAWLQDSRTRPDANPVTLPLTAELEGNRIHFGYLNDPAAQERAKKLAIAVRIEAPRRAEVISSIEQGNLTIVGIDGPVRANTTTGNISISYAVKDVTAQSENGDLDIEAVSGRVRAMVGNGNISCTSIPEGVSAEAGEGDIHLQVVGPSEVTVRKGGGRIDIGGARSTLVAVTDAGDLHVKAVPHQDWTLSSASGNIRLELPASLGFEIDAVTKTGNISVRRPDMENAGSNELTQKVNGGGKKIQVRSEKGNVVIN
jgi:hypothetical protein